MRVEPLGPSDADSIVELHRRTFGVERSEASLRPFLTDVFFEHPWVDASLPSLGWRDGNGGLVGCLGVMPRPMSLDDRPIRAVVTHNFMVDPSARRGLTALRLLKALLDRAPDLVLADGTEAVRRLCESIGGRLVATRSGRWFRVLRPVALGAHLAEGRLPAAFLRFATRFATIPDGMLTRWSDGFDPVARVDGSVVDLDGLRLAELITRHARGLRLRPVYSNASATWLLGQLAKTTRDQALRAREVRVGREVAGWFVYYSRRDGVGRVLQLAAEERLRGQVLRHLFADALREGNVALSGQADPAWTMDLEQAACALRPGTSWVVAHTSLAGLGRLLEGPEAFLSRLEGEGWLRFAR